MTQKFDPAPFDKHADNPTESINVDLIVDNQLREGTVGGSFPRTPPAPRNRHPRSTTETLIDGNLSRFRPFGNSDQSDSLVEINCLKGVDDVRSSVNGARATLRFANGQSRIWGFRQGRKIRL